MSKVIHLFKCSCEGSQELSHEDFTKHLSEVHNLKSKDLKGKKKMVIHLDGAKFFSSTYKWTLENGLSFAEFYESPRNKETMLWD